MNHSKMLNGGMALMLIVSLSVNPTSAVSAEWTVDAESGIAFNGYNDARIPGNSGTDISLTGDLHSKSSQFIRLRFTKSLGKGKNLSLLVAPLRFSSSGKINRDVNFNNVLFTSGSELHSKYRFDSYRVTYQQEVVRRDGLKVGIGFTAKVRSASIQIWDNGQTAKKANTGFVPLINFAVDWRLMPNAGLILEGDALAAPQGRAEDVLVAIYHRAHESFRIRLGYRILEGGADNDEVYTFALVHYLSAGVTWSL
jgi:hypothetical protein